jgi:hypothetical protein
MNELTHQLLSPPAWASHDDSSGVDYVFGRVQMVQNENNDSYATRPKYRYLHFDIVRTTLLGIQHHGSFSSTRIDLTNGGYFVLKEI